MPQSIWPWAGKRNGRAEFAEIHRGKNDTVEYDGSKRAILLLKAILLQCLFLSGLASKQPVSFSRSL
jgi:hypothetical protein